MQTYPPGTRIGQYEIASRPMMGGMGVVYFALDHGNDGRPVALKTFRPELLPDRAARDRFLREGTAWIELGSHPHIVRCYKVEYIDPTAFLVLELIAKEQTMPDASLRSWLIPGHPLPIEQALLFALQIARGMRYATDKLPGFVHRDLKPENILVGVDRLPNTDINRLRITDFGLATILEDEVEKIKVEGSNNDIKRTQLTNGLVGTPLYMAPEQWLGEGICIQTDMYALGCILYEMVMGHCAFVGDSLQALKRAHQYGERHQLPENVSDPLRHVIERCLALKTDKRHAAWEDVEAELSQTFAKVTGKNVPEANSSQSMDRAGRVATGWSHIRIGASYQDIGKVDIAVQHFKRAQAVGKTEGVRYLDAAALTHLGLGYAALGDSQQAIRHHEQALTIAREIRDYRGEGTILTSLGSAYANLGDIKRAIAYYEQALIFDRQLNDRRGEAVDLGNLALAYDNLGDPPRAIGFYEQALVIDREIGDRFSEGSDLGNLAGAYRHSGELQQAIKHFEKALVIHREVGNRRGEGTVLIGLGSSYADLGYTQKSISYYEEALKIAQEIGNRRGEGNALMGLGGSYVDLGDLQQAIRYYDSALSILRDIGDLLEMAMVLLNMASLYAQQGAVQRALPLAQQAVHIFTQVGNNNYAQSAQQLVDQLQGVGAPTQANPTQAAFEAFQRVDSPGAMQTAVKQYPFMVDNQFISAIEQVIKEQVPPNLKPAFEQRLTWLKQIMGKQEPGFLNRFFGRKG